MQSEKLATTIYATEWYNLPVKTQKLLQIIMIRSQRGLIFRVAMLEETMEFFTKVGKMKSYNLNNLILSFCSY